MNKLRIFAFLFFVLAMVQSNSAQNSGVRTEYIKSNKTTRVETSMLYVRNAPDQFVQLILRSWYKGDKLTTSPTKVDLEVFSFSKDQLYRKEKDRSLIIVADGKESMIGNFTNTVMEGETKNGIDSFFAVGGNSNVGMQVPVPQMAQIKASGSLNGITLEWMGISMKPDQFLKFAEATKPEIRVGSTALVLSDRYIDIIREFAKQITVP